jgi:predicted dinucleotide-binding enzyme
MRIGIFGTGMVGQTVGAKLCALGHEVKLGSRTANNEKALEWVSKNGERASAGTFADAAAFGEMLFNCTLGTGSLDALRAAGASRMKGKVLVDVSNPLDFSKGMPPTLFTPNDDSLAERIQREFPETKVVKSLNTVNCQLMVDPSRVKGVHTMFVAGNDAGAKQMVTQLLTEQLGWKDVLDLGDISMARGTETYLLLWIRLWGALGTADFNVQVVR